MPRMMLELITRGPVEAYTKPGFTIDFPDQMTSDGQRGMLWSIGLPPGEPPSP
jgi:hypothetical protein